MVKLDANKIRWNEMIEEEYQRHKEMQKVKIKAKAEQKVKRDNANKDPKKDLVEEYKNLQKEFIKIDDDETIKKWKVLSRAYKVGKQIYGQDFSVLKLSQHFDIPYTTTKRVLSLDRANERTWELINEKKITAFKVAQICMTKNIKYQDQIVDLVIAENLSTFQIKKLRIKENGLDVKTARLENAVKKGYSRKESTFKSLKDTTTRMMRLLDIDKSNISDSKIPEVIEMLDELQLKINKVIQELITNGK